MGSLVVVTVWVHYPKLFGFLACCVGECDPLNKSKLDWKVLLSIGKLLSCNIVRYETLVFIFKMVNHWANHWCLDEKNVTTQLFCSVEWDGSTCLESLHPGTKDVITRASLYQWAISLELLKPVGINHSNHAATTVHFISWMQSFECLKIFSKLALKLLNLRHVG